MIVGIDPGKNGAIVARYNGQITFFDIPKDKDGNIDVVKLTGIFNMLRYWTQGKSFCVIEKVGSRPGQGVRSTFNFGYAYGLVVYGAYLSFNEVVFVPPTRWKKDLGLSDNKLTYTQKKEKSRLLALELFPQCTTALKYKTRADRAEALLLTEWFIRKGDQIK